MLIVEDAPANAVRLFACPTCSSRPGVVCHPVGVGTHQRRLDLATGYMARRHEVTALQAQVAALQAALATKLAQTGRH